MSTTRSLHDWIRHASTAVEPNERDRCLDEATTLCDSCYTYRALLAGLVALPHGDEGRLRAVAEATLAAAIEEGEVWGFRDVASAWATQLGDRERARAALDAGLGYFEAVDRKGGHGLTNGPVRGYEWVLLGEGYVAVLADVEGLRRCLELGQRSARTRSDRGVATDLCDLAVAWGEHLDPLQGAALLSEAAALDGHGGLPPWTLANAWWSLGDDAAARRVLDESLRVASSSESALHVAKAWAAHGEPVRARDAARRARELATTAAHSLELAALLTDVSSSADEVRAALLGAVAAARTAEERVEIAAAFARWLGDEAAAARVGARGSPPEALRYGSGADDWDSSASGLFDWLRARVTKEQLTRIARADYGMDWQRHLSALEDICGTGLVPRSLGWEPHEVLALSRWQEGENTDHVERALSCVLLCLAPGGADTLVTDGVLLAESCLALGGEAPALAERFFAWLGATSVVEGGRSYDEPMALLLLFLLRAQSSPDDVRLAALATRIVTACEDRHAGDLCEELRESMRARVWAALLRRILVPLAAAHGPARQVLALFGDWISASR